MSTVNGRLNSYLFFMFLVTVLVIATGCTGFMKPRATADPIQEVHDKVAQKIKDARIDAGSILSEANEAGCDMTSIAYTEGHRKSTIIIACGATVEDILIERIQAE